MPQTFVLPRQVAVLDGVVSPFAVASFYQTGTSTPQSVYTDSALSNGVLSITADSAGVFQKVYLNPDAAADYRVTVEDSASVISYTEDNISRLPVSQADVGAALYPTADFESGITVYNHLYNYGVIQRNQPTASLLYDATVDWDTALQAAVTVSQEAGGKAAIPSADGFYKITTAAAITAACSIEGEGRDNTIIRAYGCDGFDIAANVSEVSFQGFRLLSYSSGGSASPKTHIGIDVNGTSGNLCQYITCRDLAITGFDTGIDWSYTWFSVIDHCLMTTCENDIRLFGQTVNNFITNGCALSALGGNANILTVKDGATRPEGLHVTDSFLGEGDFGIESDGILGLFVDNCIVDLIQDTGITVLNAPAMSISNSWISAVNFGIELQNLGAPVVVEDSISNCHIYTSAAAAKAIFVGISNSGVNITGGSLTSGGSGADRCLYVEAGAEDVSIVGTHLINAGSNPSIFVNEVGFKHAALTGNVTIQYNVTEAYTGTLTGCTTSPTGSVVYSTNDDTVTLAIPAIAATSNTTAATITGMPADIRPSAAQSVIGITQDNGTSAPGKIIVETNGTLTLHVPNTVSPVFTNSGTKGIGASTVTYRRF
jgi:hypothetical protein